MRRAQEIREPIGTMDIIYNMVLGLLSIFIVSAVLYLAFLRFRSKRKLSAPKDTVILYQIGRGPRSPSISPFPLKLETFLRMNKIPYMNDHSARFSYKGKTPWIEYNGLPIADSQLSIEFLKRERNIDPNLHLSAEDKAIARGFLKLTEENLYWTMCLEMFGDNLEPIKTVIPYRGLKLWFTVKMLRFLIGLETWGHGIGRHNKEEVWLIAVDDMTAISNFLGDKKFLMGDQPSEVDCALFGMLIQIILHMPGSRHEKYIKEHLPNLVNYCDRMREKFWPDWQSRILEGEGYTNDHGHLYFVENIPEPNGNTYDQKKTN
ncbi:hypothetical protein ACJMK2_006033 [Sinanodonta woodiana]|uniref:Failed axon connections homolog n=1 Tax=Sinanodonta woodiana TaxID=1069815 RepID=A0ABD3VS75_SINWO